MVIKALDPDWIRIRIGIHPKMLDPDPDEMNADPQPWLKARNGTVVADSHHFDEEQDPIRIKVKSRTHFALNSPIRNPVY